MINKKLLSFDHGALRYVGANVAFQWLGMLCNVIFVRAVLGVSLNLYQSGKMGVEGVLVCTFSALSSFARWWRWQTLVPAWRRCSPAHRCGACLPA